MSTNKIKINGIPFTFISGKPRLFFPSPEDARNIMEYNLIKMINGKLTRRQEKRLKLIEDKYFK